MAAGATFEKISHYCENPDNYGEEGRKTSMTTAEYHSQVGFWHDVQHSEHLFKLEKSELNIFNS